MSEQDEYGWVIEAASPPIYWDGRKVDSFTDDPSEAVRFARFEDAERVRCWLIAGGRFCKSVQHGWAVPAPPAGERLTPCPGEDQRECSAPARLAEVVKKWEVYREQRGRWFDGSMVDEVAREREDILMGEFLKDLALLSAGVE